MILATAYVRQATIDLRRARTKRSKKTVELSIKEKILVGVIGVTLFLAIGGTAWAFLSPHNDTKNRATQASEKSEPKKGAASTDADSPSLSVTQHKETKPTSHDKTATSSAHDKPSTAPTDQSKVRTSPRKTTPARVNSRPKQQEQVASCDTDMKSSYEGLRKSQVNAENANWSSNISQWSNEASGRGISFSGFVQDKINQHKAAHNARLAQIESTYLHNLASINCN